MVYTFGLAKVANIRYRDAANRLSRCELSAMLHALSLDCEVAVESIGGADFLVFESRALSGGEIERLRSHSSVVFMAEREADGRLRPLDGGTGLYLEEDLPEILKYKGKTSAAFTRLMINMALSLSPFFSSSAPLTLLDPLCGKGTSCFCALQGGMNAVGMDLDQKAVHEACDYFSRYLKVHQLKHTKRAVSETFLNTSLPVTEFVFADTREHYQQDQTRSLRLAVGDTVLVPGLCRRRPAHLLVADLPYGVQHAPRFGRKPESFHSLLARALPQWKKALQPSGVAALSFNTLTFPTQQVIDIARESGWTLCEGAFLGHLRHEVEQAVVRDVIFITNTPFEGGT